MKQQRKSSKTVFTATYHNARYIGNHPHIANKEGVYYYSLDQSSYLFRPKHEGQKEDWYRVNHENLEEI